MEGKSSVQTMSRITLAQRLYISSSLLVGALLVVAAMVWSMMSAVSAHAEDVRTRIEPQLQRIAELELNVTRASLQLRHAILARTSDERSTALTDVVERKRLLEARLAEFTAGMSDEASRRAAEPLPGLMAAFWRIGAENVQLIEAGKKDEAFAFLVEKTVPARNALLAPLVAEKKRQSSSLIGELQAIAQDASRASATVAGAVVLVALGLMGFSAYIVRVMRQLGAEPEELKRTAEAVAGGELGVQIVLRPGDQGSVMAALKTMTGKLLLTVQTVRQNADSVATASAQIASGNADLSARTEQQASALQQTAASMEELGTTVHHTAENARQADALARNASEVARRGGDAVREVVATMKGINESSRKISDILGAIDGIAFQTNILALNAAVEAARAGEQGRGFAVVAGEVRSLAQRAATAAREIKALIEESVARTERGTHLVDQAGATMLDIVSSIQRVSDIVGEITTASGEQSEGVQQVTGAVTQMDRSTQQNAALVEESAAAAESLSQQSRQLVQAVAVFKLV
jgi:methyl-accepting chemotaxis protein